MMPGPPVNNIYSTVTYFGVVLALGILLGSLIVAAFFSK